MSSRRYHTRRSTLHRASTVDRDASSSSSSNETAGRSRARSTPRHRRRAAWYVADIKTGSGRRVVGAVVRHAARHLPDATSSIYDWATNTHDRAAGPRRRPRTSSSTSPPRWRRSALDRPRSGAARRSTGRCGCGPGASARALLVPFEVTPSDDAALTGPTATPRPKGPQRIEPSAPPSP